MIWNPFRSMINSGAVDTHIDPYTHTNEYSSEPPVAVCYSCCFTIYYKTRGEIYASPWINNLSTMPVTSLPVLFSFLVPVFLHPCDQITLVSGQTMMDTITPRGPRYISPSSEEKFPILSYQVT